MMRFDRSYGDWLLLLVLAVFAGLSFVSATSESVTIDEFRHLSTGVHYWQSGDFSFDSATPPLWKLVTSFPAYVAGAKPVIFSDNAARYAGWAPWFVATDFMKDNAGSYTAYLLRARIINILAATGCLAYLYVRSRKRSGPYGAIFGTTFLAFSPTFLAHSHYATTDIVAACTLAVLVFQALDYQRQPKWRLLLSISTVFGISLLCKFTALVLLPLLFMALAVGSARCGKDSAKEPLHGPRPLAIPVWLPVRNILIFSAVALLVVNAGYAFTEFGPRLADMELHSVSLGNLAKCRFGQIPLPLPRAFVEGFDHQKADSDFAEFPSYLMGRWSAEGFWYYYPVAFCLKETIPFILLLFWVIIAKIRNRNNSFDRVETFTLWYLPVCLFLVLDIFNKLDIGVRYLLPAYPVFCYCYGKLFSDSWQRRPLRYVMLGLLAFHIVSVVKEAPHYTSYFNEIVGGAKNGYRFLVDSNLDWGQDLIGLQRYMQQHGIGKIQLAYFGHALPEFYGIAYEPLLGNPKPGYVAISATLLQGQPYLLTYLEPPYQAGFDFFSFMRKFEPTAQIGNSILVYRIE